MVERESSRPYESVVKEYVDRAIKLGEKFEYRLDKVYDMFEKGGNCDAATLAFTHPQFADRYKLEHPMWMLTMFPAAQELASLSGEKVSRDYFGPLVAAPDRKKLSKDHLEEFLKGSNSVWFMTIDQRNSVTGNYDGYDHILGIVPAEEEERYVVMDISGYINPLVPLSVDEIYQEIEQLPVRENEYLQGLVDFRNRKSNYKPKRKIKEYSHFNP